MSHTCTKIVTHSRVKVEEKRKKAIFKNPNKSKYEVSRVDNCLIKDGTKCDYLVSKFAEFSVFVELKGQDVSQACDQLLASVKHPAVAPLIYNKLGFLIICQRYPRIDSYIMRAKVKFAKEFKAGFHVVCRSGEFSIESIVKIDG